MRRKTLIREVKKMFREIENSSPIKLPVEVSFYVGFRDDFCVAVALNDYDGSPIGIELYSDQLMELVRGMSHLATPKEVIRAVVIHEYSHLIQSYEIGHDDIRKYYEVHLDPTWTDTYRTIAKHFNIPKELVEDDISFCKEFDLSKEWRDILEEEMEEWKGTNGLAYIYNVSGKFGWLSEEWKEVANG